MSTYQPPLSSEPAPEPAPVTGRQEHRCNGSLALLLDAGLTAGALTAAAVLAYTGHTVGAGYLASVAAARITRSGTR